MAILTWQTSVFCVFCAVPEGFEVGKGHICLSVSQSDLSIIQVDTSDESIIECSGKFGDFEL